MNYLSTAIHYFWIGLYGFNSK